MQNLILIGGGGHCKSCIDVIEQQGRFDIAGVVERLGYTEGGSMLGYPILGTDDDLSELRKRFEYAIITVGQIKTPQPRIRLYRLLKKLKFSLPVILSRLAYVSKHAEIGDGTIIMHHALINARAKIGSNCIISNKALIEHDAIIGDHCHMATGTIINGGVKVGSGTFLGSNAVCKEYIEIGENVIIGCGATIIKNIPTNTNRTT